MSASPDYDGDGWDYPDDVDDDGYTDDDRPCSRCGGEWWMVECDDPIQCCKRGCDGVNHGCDACNDTGLAKNQWSW